MIATTGDYWSYTVVCRSGLSVQELNESPEWEPPAVYEYEEWSDMVQYGTLESMSDEQAIEQWVHQRFALPY